jgi:hypothetical protein
LRPFSFPRDREEDAIQWLINENHLFSGVYDRMFESLDLIQLE